MKNPVLRMAAVVLAAILLGVILVSDEPDAKLLTAFLFYILAVIFLTK